MKLTRHNGRSGKNGTYNPRHNDRRFDVENSGHIDSGRTGRNIYWDCYRGFTTAENRKEREQRDFTFEEIERMYYWEHYSDHVEAQNARNEKTRHTERNRTVEDLLKNNKTCPEESIYQIGTIEESVPPEVLFQIVNEFYEDFERRFGSHVHILDWALHLDEGTPHIHERHVFDCENRYGELCPQQEKALEEMGVPLPDPDKPKGRNNNRKQTFDAACRVILFDITRRHGLHLEQEPSYGGREYLEKQDYILMKQKEQMEQQAKVISHQKGMISSQAEAIEQGEHHLRCQERLIQGQQEVIGDQNEEIIQKDEEIKMRSEVIKAQEQELEELTIQMEDVEALLDEVADIAYDKAVELVTDEVKIQTHKEDIRLVDGSKKWVQSPERKASRKEKEYALARLDGVIKKITNAMQTTLDKMKERLLQPAVKKPVTEQIKEQARPSIMARLEEAKVTADRKNRERRGQGFSQPGYKKKQDMEH